VKQAISAYVNHARIRSCNQPVLGNENQPVLGNEGKVSCSRKQWEPLMGLKLTPDRHPPIISRLNENK